MGRKRNINKWQEVKLPIKLAQGNQTIEINRRRLAWIAFGELSSTLKNKNNPMHLRRQTTIPAMGITSVNALTLNGTLDA